MGGWWPLKRGGKKGGLRDASGIAVSQGRQKGQWRDHAHEEDGQDGQPVAGIAGMGVGEEQDEHGKAKDACGKEYPSPNWLLFIHRSLTRK